MTFEDLQRALSPYIILDDWDVLAALHGSIIANRELREPVWLVLVGPPASAKTMLSEPLECLEGARLLNDISARTFLSGFSLGKGRNQSLLLKLSKEGIYQLINLDFGNIFAKGRDERAGILQHLRQIYDKKVTLDRGSGDSVYWKGHLGFVGCATPAVYRQQDMLAELGDRFIFFNMNVPDENLTMDRALANLQNFTSTGDLIQEVYRAWHESPRPAIADVILTADDLEFIKRRSSALARIRSYVHWTIGFNGKEITEKPFWEQPNRIARTMTMLMKSITIGWNRTTTNTDIWRVIDRIFSDTAPPARRTVLDYVLTKPNTPLNISEATGYGKGYVGEKLRELMALDLVVEDGGIFGPSRVALESQTEGGEVVLFTARKDTDAL